MFTSDLTTFKIREKELHRQAAHYRLARRLGKANPLASRLAASAGRMLISAGEQMLNRSEK